MSALHFPARLAGAAAFGGPLLAAAIGCATPAQADASSFLNDLHRDGIHAAAGGDDALLQAGMNLCQQLSWGAPPAQLESLALQRSDDRQGTSGLTPQQAGDIVGYAQRDLCPDA